MLSYVLLRYFGYDYVILQHKCLFFIKYEPERIFKDTN